MRFYLVPGVPYALFLPGANTWHQIKAHMGHLAWHQVKVFMGHLAVWHQVKLKVDMGHLAPGKSA